jgi:FAD binding domain
VPFADGVVISMARMRRILEFDPDDRRMVLEPGVTNAEISRLAAPHGLYFAPAPSSQTVCTIGGNVAWEGTRRRPRARISNNTWLHTRAAALNLRRLINLGLTRTDGAWTINPATT